MIETLQEYADARGAPLRVDRTRAVIQGVKILGLDVAQRPHVSARGAGGGEGAVRRREGECESSQGRTAGAARLSGPHGRDPRRGSCGSDEGLFGDFYFNPKHALAEQLLWDAEHAAENVGFSHNVEARTARRGERTVVEAILKVQSVDLVADPATTRSLFESADPDGVLESITVEELRRLRPDLIEALLTEQAGETAPADCRARAAARRARGRRATCADLAALARTGAACHRVARSLVAGGGERIVPALAAASAGRSGRAGARRGTHPPGGGGASARNVQRQAALARAGRRGDGRGGGWEGVCAAGEGVRRAEYWSIGVVE